MQKSSVFPLLHLLFLGLAFISFSCSEKHYDDTSEYYFPLSSIKDQVIYEYQIKNSQKTPFDTSFVAIKRLSDNRYLYRYYDSQLHAQDSIIIEEDSIGVKSIAEYYYANATWNKTNRRGDMYVHRNRNVIGNTWSLNLSRGGFSIESKITYKGVQTKVFKNGDTADVSQILIQENARSFTDEFTTEIIIYNEKNIGLKQLIQIVDNDTVYVDLKRIHVDVTDIIDIFPRVKKVETSEMKIPVSNVPIALRPLQETDYGEALKSFANWEVEYYPQSSPNTIVQTRMHPFIAGLHYSFSHHRPFRITPDMVWLMILQGVSKHIHYNKDELQSELVNFTGTQKISVRRDLFKLHSLTNDWESVLPEISNKMKAHMDKGIYNMYIPQFSTTTSKETFVYEITMMDAMEDYFSIDIMTACGIPYIILEGSPEDWQWIKDQLPKLNSLGLEFWTKSLIPIIDQLHASSQGNHNRRFWQSIYKWSSSSGGDRATGWCTRFFPYLETKQSKPKLNKTLTADFFREYNGELAYRYGLSGEEFPAGRSTCDFNWIYYNDTMPMQFVGGFVGLSQDSSFVLKPEIDWFICNKRKKILRKEINKGGLHEYLLANGTEIDFLRPKSLLLDSVYYNFSDNPDEMPIFNPAKNKTYEEGWEELLSFIESKIKATFTPRESGIINYSFYIYKDGTVSRLSAEYGGHSYSARATKCFPQNIKWKPAFKNGKVVLKKMEITVSVKDAFAK